MSPPEVLLWTRLRMLRGDGPTFRRQHPISPYIADFYCAAAKLVIEVDRAAVAPPPPPGCAGRSASRVLRVRSEK